MGHSGCISKQCILPLFVNVTQHLSLKMQDYNMAFNVSPHDLKKKTSLFWVMVWSQQSVQYTVLIIIYIFYFCIYFSINLEIEHFELQRQGAAGFSPGFLHPICWRILVLGNQTMSYFRWVGDQSV